MRASTSWWWVPALAVVATMVMAALLTPLTAGRVEDAATTALEAEGLGLVEFVSVDGVDGFGTAGAAVTLQGPVGDRSVAIAAVRATDEIGRVTYLSTSPGGTDRGEAEGS